MKLNLRKDNFLRNLPFQGSLFWLLILLFHWFLAFSLLSSRDWFPCCPSLLFPWSGAPYWFNLLKREFPLTPSRLLRQLGLLHTKYSWTQQHARLVVGSSLKVGDQQERWTENLNQIFSVEGNIPHIKLRRPHTIRQVRRTIGDEKD